MSGFLQGLSPGDLIVPLALCGVAVAGLLKKVDVFGVFTEGAKEGLVTAAGVLPALVLLMTAIGMFKASGALDAFTAAIAPVADFLGFPEQAVPLALMRPISGSGGLALFKELLEAEGPDSAAGRVGSVVMGSTETTFYTIAVYFGAAGVKKTRHALPAALTADVAGFVMSALAVRLLLG